MLNHIYIDNYKSFVNFECKPQSLHLLFGENGTGKSTVYDVLESIQQFVVKGHKAIVQFPTTTLTAWERRNEQSFELGFLGNGGTYSYRLVIDHDRTGSRNRIKEEILKFDNQPLYLYDGNDAHLFRDDFSAGPVFPYDWSRSHLSTIPERSDNQRLTWFRDRLQRIYFFSPDPLRMYSRSEFELERPDRQLHSIVAWLRHLSQESVDSLTGLRDRLREDVIEGLANMKLEKVSDKTRILRFDFDFGTELDSQQFSLELEQLSEGQRNLVALFAILYSNVIAADTTVCIDEPDNFVALRELQPWLIQLRDNVYDNQSQCLLISHHPEIINYLAAHHGLVFFRHDTGPSRVKEFEWAEDDVISPAELVARGWENA